MTTTIAVVTGAGSGIGRAVALRLAARGDEVVVADVDPAGRDETVAAIAAVGGRATAVALDVGDDGCVQRAFDDVVGGFGPPTVLVNCAGGSRDGDGPLDELDVADLDAALAVDLRGTLLCCRAAAGPMKEAGGGAIVNMATFHLLAGAAPAHAYVAAKGAVVAATRAMAARWAPHHIRVNAVAPGVVLSPRVARRVAADGVDLDALRATRPAGVAEPADVAPVVAFLTSPDARLVTGATLPADGGLSLH